MASAVFPSRNEAHWGEHKVYMRKYTNHNNSNSLHHFSRFNPSPSPSPTNNPNINRFLNQNPNPNRSRHIHDFSSRAHVWLNDEPSPRSSAPPALSTRTFNHIKKESLHAGNVTFHLGSYSRRELKVLKERFISELEIVRIFQNGIEARELEFRSNHHLVQSTPSQLNSSNVAAAAAQPKVKKKIATAPGGNNKISGQKRTMQFSSAREIKRQAKADLNSATKKVVGGMMRRCGQILARLIEHKNGWVFSEPVNATALRIPNYHTIIKHPMDLGTVKSRLGKHMYGSPLDFASDVRLTFDNAMTYNNKGTEVNEMASVLLELFEKKFNPEYQKFEAEHQRLLAAQQEIMPVNVRRPLPDVMHHSQATLSSLLPLPLPIQIPVSIAPMPFLPAPAMEAAKSVVVQRRKLSNTKLKEPKKGEMSREEREKLGLSLQNLPGESMDEMLQIVMTRKSGLAPDGDGEIELDIQALDNETLWELDRFVNSHKEAGNKMEKEELPINNSTLAVQINNCPVVDHIHEAAALQKAEEDVDIGEEMPMNNYPPVEIDKDAARSSSSSSSSSSGSDSSSSSDSESESSSSGSDSDGDSVRSPCAELREAPVTGNH